MKPLTWKRQEAQEWAAEETSRRLTKIFEGHMKWPKELIIKNLKEKYGGKRR